MAKNKNKALAEATEAAGILAYTLHFLTHEHSKRLGRSVDYDRNGKGQQFVDEIDAKVGELERLLQRQDVAGPLSLANPYPAEVGGYTCESYASGVALVGRHVVEDMRRSLAPLDRDPVELEVVIHCQKEYERATGKPLESESKPNIAPTTAKVLKLHAEGVTDRTAIADRVGLTPKNVSTILSRYSNG